MQSYLITLMHLETYQYVTIGVIAMTSKFAVLRAESEYPHYVLTKIEKINNKEFKGSPRVLK